ncbi:hypothetical protein MADA3029_740067 [Vibrio nigripulchritudo MADA3029]|nr:hypothetical protein VIBNIMADA3020_710002 [Vibrio nigripulchritudo MADA3020]CCN54146.1 hypothetical protein VIBNIMADA3021_510069 [Vibrio nigripulchritudo MADA3021]CCN61216.1 hypothetical protein MADA3029_740067 [Vibrio nigripulchritudo MADA3029]
MPPPLNNYIIELAFMRYLMSVGVKGLVLLILLVLIFKCFHFLFFETFLMKST